MTSSSAAPVVLNELSVQSELETQSIDAFAHLLAGLKRAAPGVYLVSSTRLWGQGASVYPTLGLWARAPENKDKLRMILSLQNRAPFDEEFGQLADAESDIEYTFQGEPCIGLGYAHATSSLAVSVLSDPAYDHAWLELLKWTLEQSAEAVAETVVAVRHAARVEHLAVHEGQLFRVDVPESGSAVWEARSALFHHLRLLDRVREDLEVLERVAVRAVFQRLRELDAAAAEWDVRSQAQPAWRSRVTPESQSRIDAGLVSFDRGDGTLADFSLHARYTPGAGRIHFELDGSSGQIVVAYIGRKRE